MEFYIILLLWILNAIALLISMYIDSLRATIISFAVFAFISMLLIGSAVYMPGAYCSVCGNTYDLEYRYCPMDGSELHITGGSET